MIVAIEGGRVPTAAYVSYRGNLTKCAMQHLRHASALERLSSADWKEMLEEVIAAIEEEAQTDGGGDLPEDRDEDDDEDQGDGPADDDMPDPDAPREGGPGLGDATLPSLPSSTSRSTSTPFPYPSSSADLLPMATLASSRASGATSGFSSRRSSLPTTLDGQVGGDERATLEPVTGRRRNLLRLRWLQQNLQQFLC